MADSVSGDPVRKILKRNPLSGSFHSYVLVSVYVLVNRKERIGLSPHHHLRSNHLPGLAEAAAGPEDVVLIIVWAARSITMGTVPERIRTGIPSTRISIRPMP